MVKSARKGMTDNELLAIIAAHEKSALGSTTASGQTVGGSVFPAGQQMTTLEIDRYNALNAYMARPLGNEQEGRSQVVIPELRDTVEWIMPTLMRMFVGGKAVCCFKPTNEHDRDQADLETDTVNHIFMVQNDGFFVLHDFFKDALMLRNGYVQVYNEKREKVTYESYTGLSEIELSMLTQDAEAKGDKIEVVEQRETETPLGPTFDVKLRRICDEPYFCVEPLPPEEVLVSPDARHGLEDAAFVQHHTDKTRSWLKEKGFDADVVDSITIAKPNWMNLVALARNEVVDQLQADEPADKSMQTVHYRCCEMLVDYDGDGIAERRRVILGGEKILENYEIPEYSIAACAPIRMPHRHVGISFYDLLNDLQEIKTSLIRQGLDNLYLSNNTRLAVNWRTVNLSDLLVSRPGGIVRVDGAPGDEIMALPVNPTAMQQIVPALNYVDSLREMRTGIGRDTMGLDADALQDVTKGGQLAAMSNAALKVELIARLLAEGVKDIFKKLHGEIRRNQNKPMSLEIAGKWVDVDPSDWGERSTMTVNVGLGSGTREEARVNVMMLEQAQEKLASMGLVGPPQAFNTFKKLCDVIGEQSPEMYAMDPSSPQYQQMMAQRPPQQNPAVQVAQIKAQIEQQKLQGTMAKAQATEQTARIKAQGELGHAQAQLSSDHANEAARVDADMATAIIKALGQIIAQQLKQNPGVDAGAELARDYREAESGVV